jgi:ribosome-associated protein
MDIRKLQRAIVDGLEDVKAQNIVVFNTEHLSPLFERVIVASGTSNRQTKALASSVRETVKARGLPILSVEGADNGEWVIVDCGAAVAHIMQPAIRDYYRLEEIWGGKSVRMKMDEGDARPRRHAEAAAPPPSSSTRSRAVGKPAPRPAESRTARSDQSAHQTASAASTRKKAAPTRKTGARSR